MTFQGLRSQACRSVLFPCLDFGDLMGLRLLCPAWLAATEMDTCFVSCLEMEAYSDMKYVWEWMRIKKHYELQRRRLPTRNHLTPAFFSETFHRVLRGLARHHLLHYPLPGAEAAAHADGRNVHLCPAGA